MQKANNMILINHKTLKESFDFAKRSKKENYKITTLMQPYNYISLLPVGIFTVSDEDGTS